jgi:putative hydrolase of the HAD superfamily
MLKSEFAHIRNIIFDIGNVLVDIDYNVTIAEFQKLAKVDFAEIVSYSKQERIFDRFEKGEISVNEFFAGLRKYLKDDVSDAQITDAWNSILIHYPKAKFDLLEKLKAHYNVFALSNINQIHADSLDVVAQNQLGKNSFRDFFHHAYYSHEMGFRKPETEIYQLVLNEQKLIPAETLFIDDKAENTDAAASLGIQTHHLTSPDKLFELFV